MIKRRSCNGTRSPGNDDTAYNGCGSQDSGHRAWLGHSSDLLEGTQLRSRVPV